MIVIMLERIQEAILYTEQTDCRAKSELMLTFSWPGARGQPTTAHSPSYRIPVFNEIILARLDSTRLGGMRLCTYQFGRSVYSRDSWSRTRIVSACSLPTSSSSSTHSSGSLSPLNKSGNETEFVSQPAQSVGWLVPERRVSVTELNCVFPAQLFECCRSYRLDSQCHRRAGRAMDWLLWKLVFCHRDRNQTFMCTDMDEHDRLDLDWNINTKQLPLIVD